jgi:alpha-1,3-rhamnosyl/mannosyltransferase
VQIPYHYRRVRVVAFPSLLEGFGLPVLEAMASGRPVVCSDRGALPEFAIETTPLVAELWIDRIVRLLTDDKQWAHESERNAALARAYSWERTAEAMARAWREIG